MHITIDYTSAITQGAGIGRYTRNVVAALAKIDASDSFTLFSSEKPTPTRSFPDAPNMKPRIFPVGNRNMTILWQRLRMPVPVELFAGRADVFHGPDFILPPILSARRVVTVHDLAFITHPECALPSLVQYLNKAVPRALRAADQVICVSQRTADDVHEHLGVPRDRLTVIHLGVDPALTADADAAGITRLREKYGFTRPTVLAVGTIEPRKNYAALIAAFAQARTRPDGPRMLVIAGRKGWLYEGVFAAVERYGVGEHVKFLDYIPDDELATLYHAADALAMPSLYEGFGIPPLEAMACGTPVVCSDGGSLPEIVGDAALVLPAAGVEGLSEALVRVVSDGALRETLRSRGFERVRGFTWEATAHATMRVYHQVGKGS